MACDIVNMAISFKIILIALLLHRCEAFQVVDKHYPWFHLAPPAGWMNDPNGFCIADNEYHLFYQYNPLSSQEPGVAHWGHATSKDLFTWKHEPIAMYPNDTYDKTGVFSGSAIVENDILYLFYTGNVNHSNETEDHEQRQALAVLNPKEDSMATKYSDNPILMADELQPNIRDPKVWKHEDTYYMVLGNSFNNNTLGRVLLYASKDKKTWEQVSILAESEGYLGYMWECPDFYELDGQYILMFSPQGVKPEDDRYLNLYQTGYLIGTFDYDSLLFTPITHFRELDNGHDFYATQSILVDSRRIVIGWFDMWEQVYPERDAGFAGTMTIPRELKLGANGVIMQTPIAEVKAAIGSNLYSGKAEGGTVVTLEDNVAEIVVKAEKLHDFEMRLESDNQTVILSYNYIKGKVTLDRGGDDGIRRTTWRPSGSSLEWRIFVDRSSIELFCGEGEVTFSSRYFPEDTVKVVLGDDVSVEEFEVNTMTRTVPEPGNCCE